MCQGVVPTCQQTSCSPSQKPSGNFSVCRREGGGERGHAGQAAEMLRLVTGSHAARSPTLALGTCPRWAGMGFTDRRSRFDGFHRSLEHLLWQPEVGGSAVHDTLVIVVLGAEEEE